MRALFGLWGLLPECCTETWEQLDRPAFLRGTDSFWSFGLTPRTVKTGIGCNSTDLPFLRGAEWSRTRPLAFLRGAGLFGVLGLQVAPCKRGGLQLDRFAAMLRGRDRKEKTAGCRHQREGGLDEIGSRPRRTAITKQTSNAAWGSAASISPRSPPGPRGDRKNIAEGRSNAASSTISAVLAGAERGGRAAGRREEYPRRISRGARCGRAAGGEANAAEA